MIILAIDLTYNPYGGSFSQIENIFKNITEYKVDKCIVYCTKDNYELFKNFENKSLVFKISRIASLTKLIRIIWTQVFLPCRLLLDNVSLLFCPGNFSPILTLTKKIQWIGTVGPFEKDFYRDFSINEKLNLVFNKYIMIFSALTSTHVIFESEYTKNLFINNYFFSSKKASVIYLGRDDYFYPNKNKISNGREKSKGKKFLLSVSHLYPYKNIEVLLYAFSKIENTDLNILIAGKFHTESYHRKLIDLAQELSITNKVIFLGGVSKEELRDLYSGCEILIFTSPFENFAYTLIEAMSCGAPIVAANTTAMPETCDEGALYFSPYSSTELIDSINQLLSNRELMDDLKQRAIHRSSEINTYLQANIETSAIINNLIIRDRSEKT
ncbi:glycosyltransferase family 4 protein [Gammaproteobacteria bacterium]|nr:glycosyltransferase family 4 protein [Gammaproteobacteria bacterium]